MRMLTDHELRARKFHQFFRRFFAGVAHIPQRNEHLSQLGQLVGGVDFNCCSQFSVRLRQSRS